jgi:hypothetical protein
LGADVAMVRDVSCTPSIALTDHALEPYPPFVQLSGILQALYYTGDTAIFLQKAKLLTADGDALVLRTHRCWYGAAPSRGTSLPSASRA